VRRRPVGVVDVVYARLDDAGARSRAAANDGYEHFDATLTADPSTLALPIGCPVAYPKPAPTWCATPAPAAGPGMWERAVRWWRAAPQALLEPWAGAVVNSAETVHAFRAEVPGLRLLLDTGHVADWGGDPYELLALADHVQLRQGAPGRTQVHVDDPAGVVDFARVLQRLDDLDYRGRISIEYFDIPAQGWGLDDPEQWSRDLAAHVRGLMAGAP
jgi:sugar phosphate isomerase/epimerase